MMIIRMTKMALSVAAIEVVMAIALEFMIVATVG